MVYGRETSSYIPTTRMRRGGGGGERRSSEAREVIKMNFLGINLWIEGSIMEILY